MEKTKLLRGLPGRRIYETEEPAVYVHQFVGEDGKFLNTMHSFLMGALAKAEVNCAFAGQYSETEYAALRVRDLPMTLTVVSGGEEAAYAYYMDGKPMTRNDVVAQVISEQALTDMEQTTLYVWNTLEDYFGRNNIALGAVDFTFGHFGEHFLMLSGELTPETMCLMDPATGARLWKGEGGRADAYDEITRRLGGAVECTEKTKIAVFVSGGGTNLQALIDAQKEGKIPHGEIVLVIASQPTAYALTRAKNAGIPGVVCSKKQLGSQEAFEAAISAALEEHGVELIVLAGFLSILSEDFTRQWPERILNIHPSLIPSFCGKGYYGLTVHEKALEYGVKVTGATVHFVNEIPDGGKIIAQKAVEVLEGDTPEVLQRRVMEQAEWILLPQATEMVSEKIAKEKELA